MVRLDIPTGIAFDAFTAAFEEAAPVFDTSAALRAGQPPGGWNEFEAAVAANAPNELVIFGKIEATPLMAIAGHRRKYTEYLLGNPVIAESMLRHHPAVMLYAPLRILVHSDDNDCAVFTLDQPSAVFGGFGIPQVTEVGVGLDRKVANLLRLIGVEPPEALTGPASR
ncbi:DUF302 domain-containing protein [Dactylosporangium sp. CA-139066]|uniref:DUF302 domain-containing protein n=1 Tax=Dactylosporangium sp. CA-139066 TaxID=3239930 RepID=UPI003D8C8B7E